MEKEQQLPTELREPLRRLKSECDSGNEMIRHFHDKGEPNDFDPLISWMHNQFLKPILCGLEEEMSRSRLENDSKTGSNTSKSNLPDSES